MNLIELRQGIEDCIPMPAQPYYVSEKLYKLLNDSGSPQFPYPILIWNGVWLRVAHELEADDPFIYHYDTKLLSLELLSPLQKAIAVGNGS